MTIRELEIFIEVTNTKSMSEAANNLNISQPTVSHAISEIENNYNVKLFDRISKKLYITTTGINLYNYALELTNLYENIENYLVGKASNNILIGASTNVNSFFLTKFINSFENLNKELSVNVYIDESFEIIKKIKEGSIDIAFIYEDVNSLDIISEDFLNSEVVLICSKENKFASKKTITLKELEKEDFALCENSITNTFKKVLNKDQIQINKKWTCKNSDTLLKIVEENLAISIMEKRFIKTNNISQIQISDLKLNNNLKLIYNREKYISLEIKDIIKNIKNKFTLEEIEV